MNFVNPFGKPFKQLTLVKSDEIVNTKKNFDYLCQVMDDEKNSVKVKTLVGALDLNYGKNKEIDYKGTAKLGNKNK